MKALSLRQPWAQLVLWGLKKIEVRTWSRPYRGRLLVHASRTLDEDAIERFALDPAALRTGAALGEVALVDVFPFSRETWRETADLHLVPGPFQSGLYGWVFEDPQPFDAFVSMDGQRGLFEVRDELLIGAEPRRLRPSRKQPVASW